MVSTTTLLSGIVRWSPFVTAFLAYTCYTVNRKSVPFVLPVLINHGLHKETAGTITSSQNLAYTISKFIIGILSDQTSPRLLLTAGLFLSGATAILFLFYESPLIFVVLWFCNGLFQGCGWPACTKIVQEKYPSSMFGTLWSVLSASTNVAGVINAVLLTYILLNYGWEACLLFAGGISLLMSLVCYMVISDSQSHRRILEKSHNFTTKDEKNQSWKILLNYPLLWMISFCNFTVFCAKACYSDWGQLYLLDLGFSQITAGVFMGSFEIGGFVGSLLAGYLSDWIIAKRPKMDKMSSGNDRVMVAVGFTAVLCIVLHLFCFYLSLDTLKVFISSLGFLLGACFYGPITIYGIVASESVPSHLSGTAHAIIALAANVGSIVAGLPFTALSTSYSWWAVFLILEISIVLTVLLMLANYKMWLPKDVLKKHIKSS